MADTLLDAVLDAADKQTKNIERSKELVDSILTGQKEAQQQLEINTSNAGISDGRGGRDTAITVQARELADVKAQNEARTVASSLGSNMDDSSQILTALASTVRDSALNAINKAKIVEKKANSKLLDNPLQYMYDQITLDGATEEANAAKGVYVTAKDALTTVQALTQELPKTTAAIASTKSAATVQSKVEATQAAINAAVNTVQIQNAGLNIQGIQVLNQMTASQVQAVSTKFSASNQQDQLNLAKANYSLHVKQVELAIEDKTERLEQKKLSDQEQKDFAGMIQKGLSLLGYKDVADLPHTKIMQLYRMDAPNMKAALRTGMLSSTTGVPTISDDAGEVARVLAQSGAPLAPVQAKIKELFKSVWSDAADPNGLAAKEFRHDVTKVDQVSGAAGKLAIIKAKSQLGNIDYKDQTNIYSAPPLQSLASIPAIANSELYKQVLAPQVASGGLQETNPEQLVSLTVEALKNKSIDYKTASRDLHVLFTASVLQNNVTHNYQGLGLPKQDSYTVSLDTGIGINRKFNLTAQKDIDAIINSKLKASVWTNVSPTGDLYGSN